MNNEYGKVAVLYGGTSSEREAAWTRTCSTRATIRRCST